MGKFWNENQLMKINTPKIQVRQTSVWKIKCDGKMFKYFEWLKTVSYAPIWLNVFKCVSIVSNSFCIWTQSDHKNINKISSWAQDRTEMFFFPSLQHFPLFSISVFKNLFVPLLVFCLLSSIHSFPPAVGCLSLCPVLSRPGAPQTKWVVLSSRWHLDFPITTGYSSNYQPLP